MILFDAKFSKPYHLFQFFFGRVPPKKVGSGYSFYLLLRYRFTKGCHCYPSRGHCAYNSIFISMKRHRFLIDNGTNFPLTSQRIKIRCYNMTRSYGTFMLLVRASRSYLFFFLKKSFSACIVCTSGTLAPAKGLFFLLKNIFLPVFCIRAGRSSKLWDYIFLKMIN